PNNNSLLTTAPPISNQIGQLTAQIGQLNSQLGGPMGATSMQQGGLGPPHPQGGLGGVHNPYGMNMNPSALAAASAHRNPEQTIYDQQLEIAALQKECARFQQELEMSREKLTSCMNSIKNFWSPELKKERAMRKEDATKYTMLTEHLQLLQAEKQVRTYLN